MTREEILRRKVTELNKELSVLKKCVGIFCTLILLLNIYYVTRVSSVDQSLDSLMRKHRNTTKKITYVLERNKVKYDDIILKRNIKKNVPKENFNYTEEINPFVDDFVEKIDYSRSKNDKKLFELTNAKIKEEISSFKLPFSKIPEEFGSINTKEQSNDFFFKF